MFHQILNEFNSSWCINKIVDICFCTIAIHEFIMTR